MLLTCIALQTYFVQSEGEAALNDIISNMSRFIDTHLEHLSHIQVSTKLHLYWLTAVQTQELVELLLLLQRTPQGVRL